MGAYTEDIANPGDYIKVYMKDPSNNGIETFEGYFVSISISVHTCEPVIDIMNYQESLGYGACIGLSHISRIEILKHGIMNRTHSGKVCLDESKIKQFIKEIPTTERTFAAVCGIPFRELQGYLERKVVPTGIARMIAASLEVPIEEIITAEASTGDETHEKC